MRNDRIDLIKGVAILLVVLGHVIQTLQPQWQNITIENAIIMFHMPLFIFISGFLFYQSVTKSSFKDYTVKKTLRLYLPSIMWGIVSAAIIGGGKILKHSNLDIAYFVSLITTGAWFLTVLWVLSIAGAFFHYYCSKWYYAAWSLFYILLYLLPSFWCLNNIEFLLPFFVAGIICKQKNITSCNIPWNFISVSALIIFVVFLLGVYNFECSMYAMTSDTLSYDYLQKTIIRIISGFCGIIVIINLCKHVSLNISKQLGLIYIGTVTLPIYVLHQKFFILNKFFGWQSDNIFIWLAVTLLTVFASLIVYKILKNKYIRFLFFGEKLN